MYDGAWQAVITPSSLPVVQGLQQIATAIQRHGIRIVIEFDPQRPPSKRVRAKVTPYLRTFFDLICAGEGQDAVQKTWRASANTATESKEQRRA
jgi:hypothetical protein